MLPLPFMKNHSHMLKLQYTSGQTNTILSPNLVIHTQAVNTLDLNVEEHPSLITI